jgi:hypothetical protein
MGRLTSTLILVVILAGLGAYIYFVDSKRPAASADGSSAVKEKLFTFEPDKINELRVTYQGQSTLLRKSADGWKLVEPTQADADPPEAIGVATALPLVEVTRVVEENASDLAKFGLDKPQIVVEFKGEGGIAGSLKLGNKNATQSEIYALKNDDKRVVLVSSFQETSFNKTAFNLRDKKMLKFDRDKADSLTLARGTSTMELSRADTNWRVVKPVPSRSDYATVEGFIGRLASSNMAKLVEENPQDLAKYGLDKPEMTVTIGAGSAKTVLQIGKTEGEDTYARDASRPMVFTLDSAVQVDLKKNFDDYRKKELFEFRPFYLAKLRAVLESPGGTKTYELEKVKPAKPEDPETWKVTRVGGASHNADPAAMDDLLNKLAGIKAESYVEAKAGTGLDKPALVISASFDEGKFERVRFGQVGESAYGQRDGEAGIAKIEHMSLRAALQAFDAVTIPKETAAPTTGEKK